MSDNHTAQAVAERGHIVTQLREFMQRNQLSIPELNLRLGLDRGAPQTYYWLNGKANPGPKSRARLAKLTGTKPKDWEARPIGQTTQEARQIARKAPPAGTALAPYDPPAAPTKRKVSSILIETDSDGEVHIKCDMAIPSDRALRFLQGLVDMNFGVKDRR